MCVILFKAWRFPYVTHNVVGIGVLGGGSGGGWVGRGDGAAVLYSVYSRVWQGDLQNSQVYTVLQTAETCRNSQSAES